MFDYLKKKLKLDQVDTIIDSTKQRLEFAIDLVDDITKQFEQHKNDAVEEIAQLKQELIELKEVSQEVIERHRIKHSDEPWIDILGGNIDPEKGIQLKLDWNEAFINQLRALGYKGSNENALIAQYLKVLSESVQLNSGDK